MTEPLGTERIVVVPDTTAFAAELQAQVAAALKGVQAQVKAISLPAAAAAPSGIILPPGVRSVTTAQTELAAATQATSTAQKQLAATVPQTVQQTTALAGANTNAARSMKEMNNAVVRNETSLGRLTRGTLAATAASSGIFRAVSFASGAFLVGAAAGGALAAGLQEFAESATVTATTARLIESTGSAANLTAAQIGRMATAQEHLTGVDDELIQSAQNVLLSFRGIREEVGAGNQIFSRATRAALDISQVFGTSLRSTAVQLGKALQDPAKGITALRRSGISFTQDQRKLITELVETGRTLDAQKLILAEVERQVGGASEAVGRTLPGRLRILQNQARDSLGEYVRRLQESHDAGEFAAAGARTLSSAFQAVKTSLGVVAPQLVQVGEGLGRVAGGIGGGGAVLALVVGYKALGLAVKSATGVQALYTAATATAAQATLAEATAAGEATVLLQRQAIAETEAAAAARRRLGTLSLLSGALAAGAAASGHFNAALLLGTVSLTGFATRGLTAFRAARAAGAATALLRGGVAALGGPLGIAGIAAAGLAAGIYLIHRRAQQATGTLGGFRAALDPLTASLEHFQNVRERIAAQSENVTLGRLDVTAAQRGVTAAEVALARSRAPQGSIDRAGLEAQVAEARDKLQQATEKLRREEEALAASQREGSAIERARPSVVANQTRAIRQQLDALRQRANVDPAQREQLRAADLAARQARAIAQENRTLAAHQPAGPLREGLLKRAAEADRQAAAIEAEAAGIRQRLLQNTEAAAVSAAAKILKPLAASGKTAQRALALPLQAIISQFQRLPTRRETQLAIRLVAQGASVDEIFKALGLRPLPPGAGGTGQARALAIQTRREALAVVAAERQKLKPLQEELEKRQQILHTAQQQVKAAKDSVAAAQDQVQSAQESVVAAQDQLVASRRSVVAAKEQQVSARRALADAREQARLSRQSLRDTLREAKNAVAQAVSDAKSNLNQLAEAIGQTLNTAAGSVQRRGSLGEAFRRMRDEILRSRGPEAVGTQQRIAFQVNARAAVTPPDKDFARRLTDISDAFNFGRLKAPAFLREFNKIIKAVDPATIRKKLGNLAADTLFAQVRAVRQQVPLITRAPRGTGGGVTATVVDPAEAQKNAAQQIAAAQRDLLGSIRGISDAQKGVRDATTGISDAAKEVARAQTGLQAAERSRERAERELAASRRRLSDAEVKSRKRNSDAVEQNTAVLKQVIRVQAARNRLERPKPGGAANERTTRIRTNQNTHGVLAAE